MPSTSKTSSGTFLSRPQSNLVDKWRRMGNPDLLVEQLGSQGTILVTLLFPKVKITVDKVGKTDKGVPY